MVTRILYGISGSAAVILTLFIVLAIQSQFKGNAGRVNGQLKDCPKSPNCVSSQATDLTKKVSPIFIKTNPEQTWTFIAEIVNDMGGRIEIREPGYLWAIFKTPLLRFVDDLELLQDTDPGIIHIRSASRVGYSDNGVNRKRVEELHRRLKNARR